MIVLGMEACRCRFSSSVHLIVFEMEANRWHYSSFVHLIVFGMEAYRCRFSSSVYIEQLQKYKTVLYIQNYFPSTIIDRALRIENVNYTGRRRMTFLLPLHSFPVIAFLVYIRIQPVNSQPVVHMEYIARPSWKIFCERINCLRFSATVSCFYSVFQTLRPSVIPSDNSVYFNCCSILSPDANAHAPWQLSVSMANQGILPVVKRQTCDWISTDMN